jgi:hypothetical protein
VRGAVGKLVAEPAENQQRVVDRQGQPRRDGQIQREDRSVGHEGDRAQHGHRTEDREAADRQRQRRRHQATEHPHQHQKAQWDRDGFHELEIFLGLEVDLVGRYCLAAGAHCHAVTVVYQFVAESFGMLLRAVLTAGDARDDESGVTVLADQRARHGRRCGPWRGHLCHIRRAVQPSHDVGADSAGGTALCAAVGADGDQHLHVALIELAGQQLGGMR